MNGENGGLRQGHPTYPSITDVWRENRELRKKREKNCR